MRNFDRAYAEAQKGYLETRAYCLRNLNYYKKDFTNLVLYKTKNDYLKCNLIEVFSSFNIPSDLLDYYKYSHVIAFKLMDFIRYWHSPNSPYAVLSYLKEYNRVRKDEIDIASKMPKIKLLFEKLCDLLEDAFQNSPSLDNLGATLKMRYRHGMPEILISYKNIIITVEDNDNRSYQFPYGDVTFRWSFGDPKSIKGLFANVKSVNLNADNFRFISSMMNYSKFMMNKRHMYVGSEGHRDFRVRWRRKLCFCEHQSDVVLAASSLDFFTLAYKVRRWLEFINVSTAAPYCYPQYLYVGIPKAYGGLALETASTIPCERHYRPKKEVCDKIECMLRKGNCRLYFNMTSDAENAERVGIQEPEQASEVRTTDIPSPSPPMPTYEGMDIEADVETEADSNIPY